MTTRRRVASILCGGLTLLESGCATKDFVQEQLSASESKLTRQMSTTESDLSQRATQQETRLRETTDRVGETRQGVDVADQRLNGLDLRVGELGARASGAETRADQATAAARDAEARLSQRLAARNRYRLLDTKAVYFDSARIEIRNQDVDELDAVARALLADPNAILELQGYADLRGGDRYNRELARDRVEAVMRYLVQRHGIELRQLREITMGKVALGTGEKATPETFAKARRVDLRLLAPWSSWEDSLSEVDRPAPEPTAVAEPRGPATMSALPPVEAQPGGGVPAFLKNITPGDLGGAQR